MSKFSYARLGPFVVALHDGCFCLAFVFRDYQLDLVISREGVSIAESGS